MKHRCDRRSSRPSLKKRATVIPGSVRHGFNQSGFTLVECILSVVITSLILGALYGCYAAGLQSWHIGMSRADLYQNGRTALDIMCRDLEAVFLSPNDFGTRFVGNDIKDEATGRDFDNLTFIAVNNHPWLGATGQSDLTEISYYIDMDPETPELWLQRRVDPTPDRDPFSGGVTSLLGIRVTSLDFRYLGGQDRWAYRWDSKQAIPRAVRITLTVEPDPRLARPNGDRPEQALTLSTTVWLRQWYPVRRQQDTGTRNNAGNNRENASANRGDNNERANANTESNARSSSNNSRNESGNRDAGRSSSSRSRSRNSSGRSGR